ncbi:MAG: DUF4870 domain-containing protein [Candidatus Omnitrophota bacterium]
MEKNQAQTMAMLCHLLALAGFVIPLGNLLGPLILWQIKKGEDPLIDENGKEAVNFQISMTIYMAVAFLLVFIVIGIPLLFALGIANLVLVIIASIKTNNGEKFVYPLAIRLIK